LQSILVPVTVSRTENLLRGISALFALWTTGPGRRGHPGKHSEQLGNTADLAEDQARVGR
jgi:hypothetical protein